MADDSEQVGQDEIEQLLRDAQGAGGSARPDSKAGKSASVDSSEVDSADSHAAAGLSPAPAASAPTASNTSVSQDDIELLLNKAEAALASVDQADDAAVDALPPGIRSFEFQKFSGTAANTESATLELMRDVQLDMTIELGRTHMHLEDVLQLKQGAVVPLDKLAGDPADIYVNGRLVARGEVLVLNDNFCIRVAELVVGDSACA